MTHDDYRVLCDVVYQEWQRAQAKFPSQTIPVNFMALQEEVGELAQALLKLHAPHASEVGTSSIYHVQKEAIQVITMVFRVVFEGAPWK